MTLTLTEKEPFNLNASPCAHYWTFNTPCGLTGDTSGDFPGLIVPIVVASGLMWSIGAGLCLLSGDEGVPRGNVASRFFLQFRRNTGHTLK